MNSETAKIWGLRTLQTTGAITLVNTLDLPNMIRNYVPPGAVGVNLATGATYALANDTVNMVVNPRASKIMNLQAKQFADDIVFFSAVSFVGNETRLLDNLYNLLSKASPFSSDININITEAAYVSGVTLAADILDLTTNRTGAATAFDWIRRPVSTTLNGVKW